MVSSFSTRFFLNSAGDVHLPALAGSNKSVRVQPRHLMAATYARQVASEEIPPHLVAQTPLEPGRAAPGRRQWQPPDSSPRTSRLRPRRIAQGWWQAGLCPKTLLHPPALLRRKKKHRNSSWKIPEKSQGQTEKQRQTKESRSSSRRIDCYQDSGDSARGC